MSHSGLTLSEEMVTSHSDQYVVVKHEHKRAVLRGGGGGYWVVVWYTKMSRCRVRVIRAGKQNRGCVILDDNPLTFT